MRRLIASGTGLLAALILLSAPGRASAQMNSMFGSRGTAGQIGGGNLSGSPVGRSSTQGSTQGMSGQPLTGNSGFGSFGATPSINGQTNGQQQFIGRQDDGRRLVGSQQAGQQGTTGRSQQNRTNRTSNRRQTNREDFDNQNFGSQNRGRSGSSRLNIRPQQRIAFEYTEPSATSITSTLETRFGRVADRLANLGGITVTAEPEGLIVLTGAVTSEGDKRLAAMIARLEPGVRSVRNELIVSTSAQ
jgi:hypothetical protein